MITMTRIGRGVAATGVAGLLSIGLATTAFADDHSRLEGTICEATGCIPYAMDLYDGYVVDSVQLRVVVLDPPDHPLGRVDDLPDALAVGELAQKGTGAEQQVQPVHAEVHRPLHVVHVAADVRQDFGPQPQPGPGPDDAPLR